MFIKKKLEQVACLEYCELNNIEKIEKLFLYEPNRVIYVIKNKILQGIITLGDFKRNYPDMLHAVNSKGKKVIYKPGYQKQVQEIFESNNKIMRIPIINNKNEFLFEIERIKDKEKVFKKDSKKSLDNICYFNFYIEKVKCQKICIIKSEDLNENLLKKLNNKIVYDILSPNTLTRTLFDQYDLIYETDLERYPRRRELLRRISRSYTNKYVSSEEMRFFFETYNYYKELKNKGINFYVFEAPSESKLNYLTQKQKERIQSNRFWTYYYRNPELYNDEMEKMFGTKEYQEIITSIFQLPVPIKKGQTVCYEEYRSKYCNIVGGYRITLNKQWDYYKNELDIYGPCAVFGLFVKDNETIASYLQDIINQSKINYFNVNNYGIRASDIKEMIHCMYRKKYKKGDTIIFFMMAEEIDFFRLLDEKIKIIELSKSFNNHPELDLFFIDKPIHCNYKANQLIANEIFYTLLTDYENKLIVTYNKKDQNKNLNIKTSNSYFQENSLVFSENKDLNKFLENIKKYKKNNIKDGTKIGAIVMNCNPFTNGHKYLIQYAASKVQFLYIFVVEENKSFFDFESRIRLVKEGTSNLKNVIVLPSGKFIISSLTFPEYFQKEDKQKVTINASLDIEVFAQQIAPTLGIYIRFIGEEPIDLVTRQYNECMKRILPNYGIKVEEIKRAYCNINNQQHIISASKVRQYMLENKWVEIKNLVPDTTYKYLLENWYYK